jgi:glycosyltransferase involved in cell wall biosynthesis
MPSVSYVVTIYNKAPALPFLVAGLGAQEGDFEREFIFIDDGSTDGSVETLRRLTAGWRDVAIVSQANAGPAVALNAAFRQARGDYIKPMDADDLLFPHATARLIAAIEATGCAVAYGVPAPSYEVAASPQDALSAQLGLAGRVERQDDILRRSLARAQTNPSAWLARAEIVRASGGSDERVFIQDYSIELRLAALGAFARLDQPIFASPTELSGRLSGNQAQILHDMNLALTHFLAERPDLPRNLARLGFVRAATRAWAWARRRGGKGFSSPEFRRVCGARLGLLAPNGANLHATCRAFAETNSIRLTA